MPSLSPASMLQGWLPDLRLEELLQPAKASWIQAHILQSIQPRAQRSHQPRVMASQEVSRHSETAGALLGWVKAMEAAGEVACGTREQLAQRDACSSAAEAQEEVLAVQRPILAGLETDLQALQVRWLLGAAAGSPWLCSGALTPCTRASSSPPGSCDSNVLPWRQLLLTCMSTQDRAHAGEKHIQQLQAVLSVQQEQMRTAQVDHRSARQGAWLTSSHTSSHRHHLSIVTVHAQQVD